MSVSRSELKKSADRADLDFDRAVAAATAGRDVDAKAAAELFTENKEAILALAGKEADIKRAVYRVMDDAIDALAEYDKLVDKAVEDSGYTGIVADGLRDSLAAERSRIFSDAFKKPASARTKRKLEDAVRAKFLSEASKQVAALAETVGEPEVEVVDTAANIRDEIARLDTLTDPVEANALDKRIQVQSAEWIADYLKDNPRATAEQAMEQVRAAGFEGFINQKDIARLKRGTAPSELFKTAPAREAEVLEPAREVPFTSEEEEEIPDVTEHMQLEEAPKKGFMQGLAKTGRKLMLGMALLFGMKAGSPDQRLPHQEDQGPQRENAAMMANIDTMASPESVVVGDEGGTEVEQDESLLKETPRGDVEYPSGDPRNLKRALKILKDSGLKGRTELALEKHQNLQGALQVLEESGIPGKAEFQKMKAKEKREEMEAAMGRIEAMRLIGNMKSPVLDAVKRADLKKKMEQHQAFLDLMGNLDEIK